MQINTNKIWGQRVNLRIIISVFINHSFLQWIICSISYETDNSANVSSYMTMQINTTHPAALHSIPETFAQNTEILFSEVV